MHVITRKFDDATLVLPLFFDTRTRDDTEEGWKLPRRKSNIPDITGSELTRSERQFIAVQASGHGRRRNMDGGRNRFIGSDSVNGL